jgi:dihydrofolate reductase/ribosomal protein S18 acetylase RimI-like enzyme
MIEIRSVHDDPASLAAARDFVRAHFEAHSAAHDAAATERVVAALPAPYDTPRGGLWVAWSDGEPLGCVALNELAPEIAELKRMYVRPDARRRGVARRLTEHAAAVATARGFRRLRLGTLATSDGAQRLYEGAGFRRIAAYRAVEFGDTLFYERPLVSAAVFIATSLDGFIAREDGAIDWLTGPGAPGVGAGEDYGYDAFFAAVDAIVMGRNSYDLVRAFPAWPYGDKPVVVLTSRPLGDPPADGDVEAMTGSPADVVARLAARGLGRLYVDGGKTVQAFLGAGLVDRLVITTVPVLLGRGIPLFGPLPHGDVRLRHVGTRSWPSGLVQSEYEVV